jgi:L-2-hydroxyglutarate oxidase LhgO
LDKMTDTSVTSVGIVGAGIIGLAVARQLAQAGINVTVFEKEDAVATHQTGHNSGVVHAGIYYAPGSAKAKLTRRGVGLLKEYCQEKHLPYDQRGKLIVARNDAEIGKLRELERRSAANGVPGVRWVDAAELHELEPDVAGLAALLSPTTAIVDYPAITRAYGEDVTSVGGEILLSTGVDQIHPVSSRRAPPTTSTTSSSAPAFRPICWPGRPGTDARPRSSPSAVSIYGSSRTPATGLSASSTRCLTRGTRSSACTSRRGSTASPTSARTRC